MIDFFDKVDVLVVYSDTIAISPLSPSFTTSPFCKSLNHDEYDYSYFYLLELCAKNNLRAGFAVSKDIIGPGLCDSYWTYEDKAWKKNLNKVFANIIFDKFSPIDVVSKKAYKLLFSSFNIKPFNDPSLLRLFADKLKTFQKFDKYTIPTVAIKDSNVKNIPLALKQLGLLIEKNNQVDFNEEVILKDRYGAGGNNIFKIKKDHVKNIKRILDKHKNTSFVIQPFLLFDKGFQYKNTRKAADIRIIFMNKKPIQTYIRIAKKGDFRCNEHQGGHSKYIEIKDLPDGVLEIATSLVNKLGKGRSLYALDFVIANSGHIYFIEGNSKPGLYWNLDSDIEESKSKELIQTIVSELKSKVRENNPKSQILDISKEDNYTVAPNTYPSIYLENN